jgi:hypothetical protein
VNIGLSGAGGLEAFGLETINCEIDVSGIGNAQINVRNELTATITGIGGIQYTGSPEKVNKHVTGVGSIREEAYTEDETEI